MPATDSRLTRRAAAQMLLISVAAFGLTACGGGGDAEGGTISVALSYPPTQTVKLFDDFTITPTAFDKAGQNATLRLEANGKAPDWAQINQSNGVITGTGLVVGETPMVVWMTIPNTTNPVNTGAAIRVTHDFRYTFNVPHQGVALYATVGVPLSVTGALSGLVAGDKVAYAATENGLPPGVTVDATTGTVQGTPTTPGTYAVQMNVAVERNGKVAALTNVGLMSIIVR